MTAPTNIQVFHAVDSRIGDVVLPLFVANGTPVNGVTLAGVAIPGAIVLANDAGTVGLYQNTGTQASPTWTAKTMMAEAAPEAKAPEDQQKPPAEGDEPKAVADSGEKADASHEPAMAQDEAIPDEPIEPPPPPPPPVEMPPPPPAPAPAPAPEPGSESA